MLAPLVLTSLLALTACKGEEPQDTGTDFLAQWDERDHSYGEATDDVEWGDVHWFHDYWAAQELALHDDEPLFVQFNEVPG